jgi:hypothetical protein
MFINPGSRIRINPNPGRIQIDPWSVMGQTTINAGVNTDNPTPSSNGLIGEVTALPYTVPAGKILLICSSHMEGNWTGMAASNAGTDAHIGGTLAIWVGASIVTNSQFILSNSCANVINETSGHRYYIPAAKIVNVRVTNTSTTNGWVTGWGVFGYLISPNAIPLFGL